MTRAIRIVGVILLCIAIIVISAACVTAGYFEGVKLSEIDLAQVEYYINEKVIPIAVLVLTAVGSILMALLPLVSRIKRSSESFSRAEEGIRATSDDAKMIQSEARQMLEDMRAQIDEIRSLYRETDKRIGDINERESRIEEVMRIGFCNTPSLVRNGYAKKIYEMTESENEKA